MRRAAKTDKVKEDKSGLFARYWRIVYPDDIEGEAEYVFSERQWRFDWAMVDGKVAVEVEGGAWMNGRHNRGKGFTRDLEKYNSAAALGWLVFHFTPQMLDDDPLTCVRQVHRAIMRHVESHTALTNGKVRV